MGQCGCLDREREKERILQQLSYNPPMAKKINTNDYYFGQQSLSTKSHQHLQIPRYSVQQSSRGGHRSVQSDTLSYRYQNSNNQFILIQSIELTQFIKTNQNKIDQILCNPLNPSTFIICFDQNDSVDPYIYEKIIRESNFNQLYIAIKDFIASPEIKLVGVLPLDKNCIKFLYRKLNARQALNHSIEMQMLESFNEQQLEDTVNERIQDNLVCCSMVQISGQQLIFFQTAKRSLQTVNVISLDLRSLNHVNLSQEIAQKVEILQNNDEFEFISLIADVQSKSLYILMSMKQL